MSDIHVIPTIGDMDLIPAVYRDLLQRLFQSPSYAIFTCNDARVYFGDINTIIAQHTFDNYGYTRIGIDLSAVNIARVGNLIRDIVRIYPTHAEVIQQFLDRVALHFPNNAPVYQPIIHDTLAVRPPSSRGLFRRYINHIYHTHGHYGHVQFHYFTMVSLHILKYHHPEHETIYSRLWSHIYHVFDGENRSLEMTTDLLLLFDIVDRVHWTTVVQSWTCRCERCNPNGAHGWVDLIV